MCEENQARATEKAFEVIMDNSLYMNTMMINQLEIMSAHSGLTGNFREKMWQAFFRSIIPQKYSLAQGVIIIDSYGNQSKEVDIAVFDEQYTPYVFQYDMIKFIPIEAVSLVISCKSKSLDAKDLTDWSDSIDKLCTSQAGITRTISGLSIGYTNSAQTGTRPIKILAATKEYVKDDPDTITKLKDYYDFIIIEKIREKGSYKTFELTVSDGERTLGDWYRKLNHHVPKPEAADQDQDTTAEQPAATNELDIRVLEDLWNQAKDTVSKEDLLEIVEGPTNKSYIQLSIMNSLKELEIPGNPLLTLNLQLNQLLMLINNPMLFPHYAYAKRFNKILEGGSDGNG